MSAFAVGQTAAFSPTAHDLRVRFFAELLLGDDCARIIKPHVDSLKKIALQCSRQFSDRSLQSVRAGLLKLGATKAPKPPVGNVIEDDCGACASKPASQAPAAWFYEGATSSAGDFELETGSNAGSDRQKNLGDCALDWRTKGFRDKCGNHHALEGGRKCDIIRRIAGRFPPLRVPVHGDIQLLKRIDQFEMPGVLAQKQLNTVIDRG